MLAVLGEAHSGAVLNHSLKYLFLSGTPKSKNKLIAVLGMHALLLGMKRSYRLISDNM